ncbi:MAG TPA: pyridoxamine 5'-phosphate oxidase family protein [Acidimicrobiales bacterium]|nr:pyridoxamine 5'-phosphate oxidase family protein [Acidimicrobiales bacterium]
MTRSLAQRTADAKAALAEGIDAWVATASRDGRAHLVPLSIAWHDGVVLAATTSASATARNVAGTARARIGLGELRDVVMLDADATARPWSSAPPTRTAAFVAARGWDPGGEEGDFVLVELRPRRIQVWRTVEELEGRDVMRGGVWLAEDA